MSLAELFPGADVAFLYPGARVPRPPPLENNGDHTPGMLCWGAVGSLPTPELAPSVGFNTVNCNETHNEVRRETDEVRIEQDGKPENYVEVDRAHKLWVNKRENTEGMPDNSSSADPEGIGDFSPSPIIREGFKPLGSGSEKRCQYTITLNNGPRDI